MDEIILTNKITISLTLDVPVGNLRLSLTLSPYLPATAKDSQNLRSDDTEPPGLLSPKGAAEEPVCHWLLPHLAHGAGFISEQGAGSGEVLDESGWGRGLVPVSDSQVRGGAEAERGESGEMSDGLVLAWPSGPVAVLGLDLGPSGCGRAGCLEVAGFLDIVNVICYARSYVRACVRLCCGRYIRAAHLGRTLLVPTRARDLAQVCALWLATGEWRQAEALIHACKARRRLQCAAHCAALVLEHLLQTLSLPASGACNGRMVTPVTSVEQTKDGAEHVSGSHDHTSVGIEEVEEFLERMRIMDADCGVGECHSTLRTCHTLNLMQLSSMTERAQKKPCAA